MQLPWFSLRGLKTGVLSLVHLPTCSSFSATRFRLDLICYVLVRGYVSSEIYLLVSFAFSQIESKHNAIEFFPVLYLDTVSNRNKQSQVNPGSN